jgi:Tfp pilus assembly protein PilO
MMTDKDKKSLQVGVFIFVILMLVVLYYNFFILARDIEAGRATLETLKMETATLTAELEKMREMIRQEAQVNKELALVKKMAARLPSSPNEPEFLDELANSLQITGAKNQKIIPQKSETHTDYIEIPYGIFLNGRYHEFGQLLNLLEENPRRFMLVKEFEVKNDLKRPSIHPSRLDIATFMFSE